MSLRRRPILCLLLSPAALAQTRRQNSAAVFRCGPDGREIRDRPCPNEPGASAPLSYDQPSEADRSAAQRRQAAEAKEAARLARERERFEAAAPRNGKASSKPTSKPAKPARSGSKKPAPDEKTRTVRAPEAKP